MHINLAVLCKGEKKKSNMITVVVIMRKEIKYPQQTSAKGLLFPILPTKVLIFCLSRM